LVWPCVTRSNLRERPWPSPPLHGRRSSRAAHVYFTDRGIEELDERRGDEQVSLRWLAAKLRTFVDAHPDYEDAVERLATYLARDDELED
jgi:hypothetical protein